MADSNSSGSPLEAIAGAAGPGTADAFELLANETRLAILLALWEAYEPFSRSSGLTFSQLRDRVGVRDSGQFNYHLGKLEGAFVESTVDGYKLRPAGEKVTRAVIGGAAGEPPALDATDLGMPCVRCGAPTAITFRHGRLIQHCTECAGYLGETEELPAGTLFVWRLEQSGLLNRTPQEVYTAASRGMFHRALAVIDGVCPECSGTIETEIDVCDAHETSADSVCPVCGREDEIIVLNRCRICKFTSASAPTDLVTHHPAVVAFYYDHGISTQYDLDFEAVQRLFELEGAHELTIESREPLQVRVTVRCDGDEIGLRFDEDMSVIDVLG
jgi:hypothetical protein